MRVSAVFDMSDVERLSALIGDIYDAALDPALWPDVFDGVSAYLGTAIACLTSHDNFRQSAELYFASSCDPHYRELYFDSYFRINPVFPTVVFNDMERTHAFTDVIPRAELCNSKFGREWLAPQGLIDGAFSVMEKWRTGCVLFSMFRDIRQGTVDEEASGRFSLLVPHVRRSLLIGRVIDLHKVEAALLADTLDTLAAAMFLVDARGRLVHINVCGHDMLAEAKVLKAMNGRLHAVDAQADQALGDIFATAPVGDLTLGRRGVALPLKARDGERFVANVLPLTTGTRRKAGISYQAVAVVFVRKAALDLPTVPEAVAQEFHLTPAEIRVLFSIVDVGGVPEVAGILGISDNTVRTHLQHVFEKTETNRQAELVKLVAGYASPFVGDVGGRDGKYARPAVDSVT
jgi:DNA-binding CsgD family transcriptional regulator